MTIPTDLLHLAPLIIGPLAAPATEALKKAPIPFEGKTRAGIVLALTAVVGLANLGLALLNGDVASFDLAGTVEGILMAAGAYSLSKPKAPALPAGG